LQGVVNNVGTIEHVAALEVDHARVVGCTLVRCVASAAKLLITGAATTVNVCDPLVPPAVDTVTFRAPVTAPAATAKLAVS
jgi:hypothetical protein